MIGMNLYDVLAYVFYAWKLLYFLKQKKSVRGTIEYVLFQIIQFENLLNNSLKTGGFS